MKLRKLLPLVWLLLAWKVMRGKERTIEPNAMPSVVFSLFMTFPAYLLIGVHWSNAQWTAAGIAFLAAAGLLVTPRFIGNSIIASWEYTRFERWLSAQRDVRIQRQGMYERWLRRLTWGLRVLVVLDAVLTISAIAVYVLSSDSTVAVWLAIGGLMLGLLAYFYAVFLWLAATLYGAIRDGTPEQARQLIGATDIAERLEGSAAVWLLAGILFVAGVGCQYVGTFRDGPHLRADLIEQSGN